MEAQNVDELGEVESSRASVCMDEWATVHRGTMRRGDGMKRRLKPLKRTE